MNEFERVVRDVLSQYRNGMPVIVLSEDEDVLFHGADELQAIISLSMPVQCVVIHTSLSRQQWNDSDLPEICEAARRVFFLGEGDAMMRG